MISLNNIAKREYRVIMVWRDRFAKKSNGKSDRIMFYVLMAFRQGEMCGIDIADYIDRYTEGRVKIGPATLYTILAKFEKEKYIRETAVEGRKRTYTITDRGMEAYEMEVLRLRRCVADAEAAAKREEN